MSIKKEFRGKDISGTWHYGGYSDGVILGKVVDCNNQYVNFETWQSVIPETVGQFAGRIDKNETKIFEGDLLKGKGDCIYRVYWSEDMCCFHAIGNDGDKYGAYTLSLSTNTPYHKDIYKKEIEVIGNIHDNPELLNNYYGE